MLIYNKQNRLFKLLIAKIHLTFSMSHSCLLLMVFNYIQYSYFASDTTIMGKGNMTWYVLYVLSNLQEILDRTGYSLDVTTGQRKYGGPPPGGDPTPPGTGHEVGNLDVFHYCIFWTSMFWFLIRQITQYLNVYFYQILLIPFPLVNINSFLCCRSSVERFLKMSLKMN